MIEQLSTYTCMHKVYTVGTVTVFYSFIVKNSVSSVRSSQVRLCDPMNYGPPGSSVHGVLQARILAWVAIPFSKGSSWPRDQTQISCIAGRFFTIWATREAYAISLTSFNKWGLPGSSAGKESACNVGDMGLIPGLGRSPGEGNGNTPVFLPGEFHGRRSLVSYSPRGCKGLDTTEQLTLNSNNKQVLVLIVKYESLFLSMPYFSFTLCISLFS